MTAANKRIRTPLTIYGIDSQSASSHILHKTFGQRIYRNNGQSEHLLILLSHIFEHRDISLTQETVFGAYLSL